MIIRLRKKSKDTIWVSYPISEPVFSESEISFILMRFLNENMESSETINELIDIFEEVLMLKKGRTHEVVCKGREILESILQEHKQQSIVRSDESFN